MAVSNRSLVLLALVAVGLAWWDLKDVASTVAPYRRRSVAELAAVRALRDSARTLGLQLRTAAVRDRVDSVVTTSRSEAVPDIVVIGGGAHAAAAMAESLFAMLPIPTNPIHSWKLVVVESPPMSKWPSGHLPSFTMLPSADSGTACTTVTVVVPGDSVLSKYETRYWHNTPFGGAAGPCWFLARFGSPGPEVRAWLDARYWDVAGSIPPNDRALVYSGTDLADAGVLDRVFGNVAADFYRESVTLEGCAGRRPELCEESFLGSYAPPGMLPEGIVGNNRFTSYLIYKNEGYMSIGATLGVPRAASEALLAMMVDDLGPDRFAEFWASPAPVAEAFRAVAGMSLGDWYRAQLRRQMVAAGIPEPRKAIFWPSAVGILILALSGTLWLAERRQAW